MVQIVAGLHASGIRLRRWSYGAPIGEFLAENENSILGQLVHHSDFAVEIGQRNAWVEQIASLKKTLAACAGRGSVYFEYAIPRLGKRVDVILILDHVLFVIEFKVGEHLFQRNAKDQVWDYALDLKNFHEPSHALPIAPVLIATEAADSVLTVGSTPHHDNLLAPIFTNTAGLLVALEAALLMLDGSEISSANWEQGRYQPTPTIVEAATALYAGHSVEEISRSDASAKNIKLTSQKVSEVIRDARERNRKAICLVTGVPGAGKTLVGLDIATQHIDKDEELYSVFLSGNGPLVAVLREALARDKVRRYKADDTPIKLGEARSEVKMFIQNVHNFRDDCLADIEKPPIEHVALFDEAQRAWDLAQTAAFMKRKKNTPNFNQSEPEFLISCLDRHKDWAVIVCLVGSGQEINTGEVGISEWIAAVERRFQHWDVHLSPQIREVENQAQQALDSLTDNTDVNIVSDESLHLSVSVRSFRSEHVAGFINQLLDREIEKARSTLQLLLERYPIRITRDLIKAKQWLKEQARGSERYGIVVSSQAQRLKPHAIDVRAKVDPVHWFLHDKDDVRSSYYLEDVATEFQVQGLELDWACVVWDGDLRYGDEGWKHFEFSGSRWKHVRKDERKRYLLNAYRVLLTRARQGLVIVVPEGSESDPTRASEFYDATFDFLDCTGVPRLT